MSPDNRLALNAEGLTVAVGAGLTLVSDVSISVARGEVTAVIGESGSGKSITATAILGLLDRDTYAVKTRALSIDGIDLSSYAEPAFASVRGQRAGYVTQDPGTALDPTMPVGDQIAEIFVAHRGLNRQEARREAIRMLDLVRIPSAERRALDYPHAFSGGMKQRVVIAGAVALSPALLIADEPTTALDVTVQAEILALIDDLRRNMGMGVLLITHDLGVVYQIAHQVAVMYAGRVVEQGPAELICTAPSHPYTAGLLASVPDLEGAIGLVAPIPGSPPAVGARLPGCAFAERCPRVLPACRDAVPALAALGPGHTARCVNPLRETVDA